MAQEEMSEKVEPGWRSSASPEEIVQRQEAAQERARDAGAMTKVVENQGETMGKARAKA